MDGHKYSSVKELAEHLNISRTTLYKRAKSHNIKLNGRYTNEQLNMLQSINADDLSTKVNIKAEQNEHENEQIEQSTEHENEQINNEKILINQLEVKDGQINVLTERLAQAQKALDQAQQLQLIAEQRLTDEHQKVIELSEQNLKNKNFWQKLFGLH